MIRQGIRITLEETISYEFRRFIGALKMRGAQKEKISVTAIALVILGLSMR